MADVVEHALYEADEYAWIKQQVAVLDAGDLHRLDRINLATYLTDMAKRDRRELQSRLTVLAQHIIKFYAQSEKQSRSWQLTVREQQREIEKIVADSTTLANEVDAMLPKVLADAIKDAVIETGMGVADLQAVMSVHHPLTLAHMLSFDVTLPQIASRHQP